MDRQLLERMIGAGVLMVALIVIAPALLDGQQGADSIAYPDREGGTDVVVPAESTAQLRTHTIVLDRERDTPPVARERSTTSTVATDEKPATAVQQAAVTAGAGTSQSTTAPKEPERVVATEPQPEPAPRPAADQKLMQIPGSVWVVQLGSFAEQANAQRLADEVGQHGFDTFLMPLRQSGRTLYRVRVGPSETRDQAATLAGRLAKAGYSGQVTPQPDS